MNLPSHAGAEMALTLALLRSRYGIDPGDLGMVCDASDVSRFLRILRTHAVTPVVASAAASIGLPSEIADPLTRAATESRMRSLDLTKELLAVTASLTRAGIECVPFKGPALAVDAYGDPGLREFGDLDLLVARRDAVAAIRVLRADGYAPMDKLTPRRFRHVLATGHDLKLLRAEARYGVEVHWALADRSYGGPRDLTSLLERAGSVRLGTHDVPNLAREDLLPALCLHGAKHFWERLAWICDIAELLRSESELDVEAVVRRSDRWGSRRALQVGLELVDGIFGVPTPPSLRASLGRDPGARRIADSVSAVASAREGLPGLSDEPPALRQLGHLLSVMDSKKARIREVAGHAVTPTRVDWLERDLPDRLFFLYYPLRIGRLIRSYVWGDRRPGDIDDRSRRP